MTQTPRDPVPDDVPARETATFFRTFVRVMAVQLVTVLFLWLLQSTYGR